MSILKRGAPDTYTSVRVLALVCDCLSTEALRAAMCQVPQTLEATLATTLATLGVASMMPRILLLHSTTAVKVLDTLPGNVELQIAILGQPSRSPRIRTVNNSNCSVNLNVRPR